MPASIRSTARARLGAANTSGPRKSTGHRTIAPGWADRNRRANLVKVLG
jgi:hypothetical protein